MLLAPDSVAVDRGEAFATTDQRGLARTVGSAADMGAIELATDEKAGMPGIGSIAAPSVDGIAQVDQQVTTDGGTWDVPGVNLSYQWLRDGRTPIPGATSASYLVQPADLQKDFSDPFPRSLTVLVTAS